MRQNKKFQISVIIAGVLPVITSLLSGCGGGGYEANSGGVYIEPRSATLAPGQPQVFMGHSFEILAQGYKWEVKEGDRGGAITDVTDPQEIPPLHGAVTYTAPAAPGIYHLRLNPDPQIGDYSDEVTIQVR